ncbi:MAG: di-heme oxidoredictase family protein [Fimbriimonadales bacterium]
MRRMWSWGLAVTGGLFFTSGAVALQGQPPVQPGDPVPGLSASELARFQAGKAKFMEVEGQAKGLGPVFNGAACAECHKSGAVGGANVDLQVARVTRIGGFVAGVYSDLTDVGGPVIQARSLAEFIPGYPIPGEVVPPGTEFVSHRITTPLFGAGLIEAIPDATLLALASRPQPDGIRGVPNMVLNPESGRIEIGRFGWKAQHSTLHMFAADAFANEMGITNPLFPNENLPQGLPIPPGADTVADPEDNGAGVMAVTTFMEFLAPPPQRLPPDAVRGYQVFTRIHCSSCHTPLLRTGRSPSSALSMKQIAPYSDLLLHHMGSQLADGIRQGNAEGDQFRTAPLWGMRFRTFFLHDGRATTIDQAVQAHGGEAAAAAHRFEHLGADDRRVLLSFLSGI